MITIIIKETDKEDIIREDVKEYFLTGTNGEINFTSMLGDKMDISNRVDKELVKLRKFIEKDLKEIKL